MTELLGRASARAVGADPGRPRAIAVAGVAAALGCAGLGVLAPTVVVLMGWATASGTDAGATDAMRTAAQIWLAAHHVALALPGGAEFRLAPLGLTAVLALLIARAGGWAARAADVREPARAAGATAAFALTYGLSAAALAGLAGTGDVRPDVAGAGGSGFVLAAAAGGTGIAHATGLIASVRRLLPPALRSAGVAAAGAVATLLAGGALVGAVSLVAHLGRAREITHALAPDAVGLGALFVLCAALTPNLVLWAVAYAVGPGFAVGTGSAVAPTGVHLGAVPALPVLAGLPASTPTGPLAWAPVAVPLAAGIVAGLLMVRRYGPEPVPWVSTVGAGVLTGMTVGVLAYLSGGPAGPGRMAAVGPPAWTVGAAAGLEVGVGAVLCILAVGSRRRLSEWAHHRFSGTG